MFLLARRRSGARSTISPIRSWIGKFCGKGFPANSCVFTLFANFEKIERRKGLEQTGGTNSLETSARQAAGACQGE
ncbi:MULTISPECIES: hypothetical protein [Rhodobacterales]|jgi:hypothetical protein|uniref:hypothetical protein n=1 Tax=Rhodobacterales TaxID=204455 RepID=UPI0010A30CC9|nr:MULTISPECIES: hypothetical protein [Rhodobacterales]MBF9057485.1 hypothetical protein [Rhodobacterales bacterium HKCCA1065]MDV7272306.1 hypothetical protein [Thioclava sp. A2]